MTTQKVVEAAERYVSRQPVHHLHSGKALYEHKQMIRAFCAGEIAVIDQGDTEASAASVLDDLHSAMCLLETLSEALPNEDASRVMMSVMAENIRRKHFTDAVAHLPSPLPQKRGIYIASKTKHADRWRFLRDQVGEPIISTWIDEAGAGESSDLADLWRRCISEASTAQVLILYREPEDVLKGGWIELGAALASGVRVFAVGIEEFTISHDTRIQHFPDMKAAIAAARKLRAATEDQP